MVCSENASLVQRNVLRSAKSLVKLWAVVLALALPATASAQIFPPGSNGVAKPRGFTITPPFKRGSSYEMSCTYSCGAHDNSGTQDYFALDFKMPLGDAVHPAAPGKVRIAKTNPATGNQGFEPYGKFVLIEHSSGYYSLYAHLNSVSASADQWVDIDSPIGTAGATGSGSNGVNHLHFVLYKNVTVNTGDASWSGGTGVVPEPISGCTKSSGGDCEWLDTAPVWLRRDDYAPAVVGGVTTVLDLVTCNRSAGNLMYRRRDTAGVWGAWTNLGGTCASSPAAIRDNAGNLFIFVRGLNGELWARKLTGSTWSGWLQIGDSVVGRPTAELDTVSGVVRVFVRRTPNQSVYLASQQSSGSSSFTAWQNLGGTLTNSPVVEQRSDGRLDIYAGAPDYTFWKIPGNSNGTFTTEWWHPLYVSLEGEPTFVSQGATFFAARTIDDKLYLQGGATPAAATHRPALARNSNSNLILFERNRSTSATDYYYPTSGTTWSPGSFGGLATSEITALRSTSQKVIMFTWGTSGRYYREQTSSGANSWTAWTDLLIPL